MSLPSILVLVCTHNHKPFINQCLDSILNQTYKGEIYTVVSDDASTDGSQDVLKEYLGKSNIDIHFQPVNLGGFGRENWKFLFNLGEVTKDFEYISMIDGDDWIYPTRFEEQIKYIQENDLDGCHADTDHYYEDGSLKTANWWQAHGCYIENPMTVKSQITNNRIFTNTLIAKSDLFIKAADFDYITSLGIFLGDYALSSRLCHLSKKIGYVDSVLAAYRWRANSESHKDHDKLIADTGLVSYLLRTGKLLEDLR